MKKDKKKSFQIECKVVIGGKYGKIKGFNFYFQENERLKPFQRRKLLKLSDVYISNLIDEETRSGRIIEMMDKSLHQLDNSQTDEELQEHWNLIYDKYGMRIPQLERRWYRDNGIKDFGEVGGVSEPIKSTVVEYLKSKKGFKKVYDF